MKERIRTVLLMLALVIGVQQVVVAQRASVFPAYFVENPQRYGEGIFRHIIDSDNFFRQGKFEEALNSLDYALSQDPYFAEAYIKRAIVKHKIGRTAEAQQDYEKATKINPYVAELYGFTGPLKRLNVIASDYENWLQSESAGELVEASRADILSELSDVIEQKQQGDILGALKDINHLLDASRQPDAILLKLRGNIFLLLDQPFRAIQDYTSAIAIDPRLKEAYFNGGIAKIMTYNRADACYDIQESINYGYERGKEFLQYFCNF